MSRPPLGWPFMLWAAMAATLEPGLRLLLRRRLGRGKEIAGRLQERRGRTDLARPDGTLLWLHAASVGESLSLLPLMEALCRQRPALHLLVTTGTVTAQTLLAERLPDTGFGSRVQQQFVPMDVPRWIGRFLDHWRPDVAVLVESELWPSLIAGCVRRDIPLALLNARLSDASARRWSRGRFLARRLFGAFAWITARSSQDADRLRRLGATNVGHDGDLKRAAAPLPVDAAELARLRGLIAGRPVWLAASTHEGEEATIGRLHARLAAHHPALLTIVAPRHPERGPAVARELGAPRRAAGQDPDAAQGIWVCDTLGEFGLLYRLAGIVLLGNSLASGRPPGGGHNPLEPCRLGCAVATGPRSQNFEADMERLAAAEALTVLPDEAAAEIWLDRLLGDPQEAARLGANGRAAAAAASDLPDRLAGGLLRLLDGRTG